MRDGVWAGEVQMKAVACDEYRPEIDGLRAIAVLPVLLFHAGIPGFGGGYVGVDIFFVISGFLITTVIMEDLKAERFSLARFYTRRVRRIIPALALVILICLPVAWFLMLPHQLKEFSKSLFAVATFASNLLFWLQSDYFAPDAHLNPLLHTWSLGVEEQYYLVFPILMLLLWKHGKRAIAPLFVILLLGSLAAAEHVSRADPVAAFFLTPYRLWELFAGAIAAKAQDRWPDRRWNVGPLAGLGMVLVLGSVALLEPGSPVPGLVAVPAIAGTVLLLLFGRAGTVVGHWLAKPALVGIGLISYSLYLWHQPLLAFARIATLDQLSLVQRSALLLAAFPLAFLSWALVEKPFREGRRVSTPVVWAVAALFTTISVIIGMAGYLSWGFYDLKLSALPPEVRPLVIDRSREVDRRNRLWDALVAQSDRPFGSANPGGRILILGDSKSQDVYVATRLMPQLFRGLSVRRLRLDDPCMGEMVLAGRGQNPAKPPSGSCRREVDALLAARLIPASDTVVFAATWQEQSNAGAASLARELHRLGKRVIVLGTANFNDVPSLSMRVAARHMGPVAAERYFWDNKRADAARIAEQLHAIVAASPGIEYRSAYDIFCDDRRRRCRLKDQAGRPLMFDYGHVTVDGGRFMAVRLAELGWLHPRPNPVL